uniref:Maturase n=1 Tax=Raphidocelis subcapitata TaxID=307507 RepID=A0A2Z6FBR4_9CHLO|nr:maturase [Raphidocelis subcapitata]
MYLNKKKYNSDTKTRFTKIILLTHDANVFFSQAFTKSELDYFNDSSEKIKKRQQSSKDDFFFDVNLFYQYINVDSAHVKKDLLASFHFFSYNELKTCIQGNFNQHQKILNYCFEYLIFNYIKRSSTFDFFQFEEGLSILDLKKEKSFNTIPVESSLFKSANFFPFLNARTSRTLVTFWAKDFFINKKDAVKYLNFMPLKVLSEKQRLEHRFFDFYRDIVKKKRNYPKTGKSWKKLEELSLNLNWTCISRLFYLIGVALVDSLKTIPNSIFSNKLKNKILFYYQLKQLIRYFWISCFNTTFFDSEIFFESKSLVYNFSLQPFTHSVNLDLNLQPIQMVYNLMPLTFQKPSENCLTHKRTRKKFFNKKNATNEFDFLCIRLINIIESKQQKLTGFSLGNSKSTCRFSKLDFKIVTIYKSLFDFFRKHFLLNLKKPPMIKDKTGLTIKKNAKTLFFINCLTFFQKIEKNFHVKKDLNQIRNCFGIADQKPNLSKNKNTKKNQDLKKNSEKIIQEWDFLNMQLLNPICIKQVSFFVCEFLFPLSFSLDFDKIEQKLYYKNFCSIREYLFKIKTLLKTLSTQLQIYLIKKLTPKFYAWSYRHRFFGCLDLKKNKEIDHAVTLLLWRWSLRRHNNKAKHWIRTKYFYCFNENNWIFGNFSMIETDFKSRQTLIYLPSHFQILFFFKKHWCINRANYTNVFYQNF